MTSREAPTHRILPPDQPDQWRADREEYLRENAVAIVEQRDAYIERLRTRVRKLEASTADRKRSLRAAGHKIEHLEREIEGYRLSHALTEMAFGILAPASLLHTWEPASDRPRA